MRHVSARFDAAIREAHQIATEAAVIDANGAETIIEITSGSVTLDQAAAVRGRCDVTLVDDGTLGLVPDSPASLLAPYGNEVRLSRGIMYTDGTTELVSLGVFGFEDTGVDDGPEGVEIKIAGLDRAQRFVRARFEEPYNVAAGTNYSTAILGVLQAAWPDVPHSFAATALTTPALIAEEGGDRWQFAQDMAKAMSMRLYFDGDGVCVLAPDILSQPVFTLAEGEDGVLLTAGRRWTRDGAYNRVIATGENTGEAAPVRGVATDDNPLSPTYYYGRFGKVPFFFPSPLLTTDAMCAAAAQTRLNNQLGTSEQVSFGSLVLPHLEPSDTVRITRLRAGIDEDHVLDSIAIPLAADGAMGGATRARQVT